MSVTKSVVAFGYRPGLIKASQTRKSLNSQANFAIGKYQSLGKQDFRYLWTLQKEERRRSSAVYSVVQPEAPPPAQPPFNFLNWIVRVVVTIILPFFSHKWGSILKLKNRVDNAVEKIEVIVDAVEKVAEEVEKAAEHIADDLPEGGRLRKAVDFVENVAERASKDAHLVGDFIDKVHEAEEKAEACVESLAEEDRAHEQPKETNNEEHKHY